MGESLAVCVRGGPTTLIVPEDEVEMAAAGFADSVEAFTADDLTDLERVSNALQPGLSKAFRGVDFSAGPLGIEMGGTMEAAPYLAFHIFGAKLPALLAMLLPDATFVGIDNWVRALGTLKTKTELERIRQACAIARSAFLSGAQQLRPGMNETGASQLFRGGLMACETSGPEIQRCDGFVFCMSGPNSAKAHSAYARNRCRTIESPDLVMIHCNSYIDGFWTDITRTFTLQTPDEKQMRLYGAVFAARKAALSVIRPGASAADVDAASEAVIRERELGRYLKHGVGHGVGICPCSARSIPRVHRASRDILREGMVFNVEPALYIEGYGGIRHCDMVAVTADGYELFTDFQTDEQSLCLANPSPYEAAATHEIRAVRTNRFLY
jgi:Xaa-Pro aminopeptidase